MPTVYRDLQVSCGYCGKVHIGETAFQDALVCGGGTAIGPGFKIGTQIPRLGQIIGHHYELVPKGINRDAHHGDVYDVVTAKGDIIRLTHMDAYVRFGEPSLFYNQYPALLRQPKVVAQAQVRCDTCEHVFTGFDAYRLAALCEAQRQVIHLFPIGWETAMGTVEHQVVRPRTQIRGFQLVVPEHICGYYLRTKAGNLAFATEGYLLALQGTRQATK